ncbi:MAG: hypothetical protein ABFE13_11355 [Phycisphaerales bacterium]
MTKTLHYGGAPFGSLVTRSDPSALEPGQLQQAINVYREQAGALRCLPAAEQITTGYIEQGEPCPMGIFLMNYDNHTHVFYRGSSSIYDYDVDDNVTTAIGTVVQPGADPCRFVSDGLRVYILNGHDNKVWDGTNMRSLGPLFPAAAPHYHCRDRNSTISMSIVGVTAGAVNTTLQLNVSGDHGMQTGDYIWLYGFTGGTWGTMDEASYVVTRVDALSVSIELDSSGLGTWSAGYYIQWPCGTTGTVKIRISWRVTMPSGQVIESSAFAVRQGNPTTGSLAGSTAGPEDQISITATTPTAEEVAAWIDTPTSIIGYGTDAEPYMVYAVLWRTAAGSESYQEAGTTGVSAWGAGITIYDKCGGDANLGAFWTDDFDAHDPPPSTVNLGCICQQSLFLAGDTASPNSYYKSLVGEHFDYFPPGNEWRASHPVTVLKKVGDSVVVGTENGFEPYYPVDEVGQAKESQSPVGTKYPDSVCVYEGGMFYCRDDGLWRFDGVTSERISEPLDSLWSAGTWIGGYATGAGTWTNGIITVRMRIVNGSVQWQTVAPTGGKVYLSIAVGADDRHLWGLADDGYIYRLESGTGFKPMTARTRQMGNGLPAMWARLVVDMLGRATVTVTTSRGNTQAFVLDHTSQRATERRMIRTDMIGEWADVTIVTDPAAYAGQTTVYSEPVLEAVQ